MIRSMTGWGEAEAEVGSGRIRVEIRSVNHRYFNPHVRLPPGLERRQPDVEGWLKEHIARGHVNYVLSVERVESASGALPEVDVERGRAYARGLRRLRSELGLEGPEPTLRDLAPFRDLFRVPEPEEAAELVDGEALRRVTEEAVHQVVLHREDEGRRLEDDLRERLAAMEAALDGIEERAPVRIETERDRLRERIRELLDDEDVDEDRLAREVAYLAEKWDVNEELVRFRSHVGLFREALGSEAREPVGKRLAFIVQEMHREANTIGAKANDAEISTASVTLKEEIERLREQVENVE